MEIGRQRKERCREMHQLVLRKSLTLELPHVEKIHLTLDFTSDDNGHMDSQKISGPTYFLMIADDMAQ